MTDSSGNVVASYAYDAFGGVTATESFPNGWSNPFRYDGEQGVRYDTETGLYWMSVRAYDPTLGRFISHDPLGRLAAMGLNMQPYTYAGNNPVNYTDPSGMLIIGAPRGGDNNSGTAHSGPTAINGVTGCQLNHNLCRKRSPTKTTKYDPVASAKGVASMAAGFFKDSALAALKMAAVLAATAVELTIGAEVALALAAAALAIPGFGEVISAGLSYLAEALVDAAALIASLAEVAAGIAAEAFAIAGMFAAESGNSKSWWTAANINGFRFHVQAVRYVGEYSLVGLLGVRKLLGLTPLKGIAAVLNSATTFFVNDQAFGSQIDWFICIEKQSLNASC